MFTWATIKAFFATKFTAVWGYLLAGGAIVAGILVAISRLKKAGRDEVKSEINKKSAETNQRQLEIPFPAPGETEKALREGKF